MSRRKVISIHRGDEVQEHVARLRGFLGLLEDNAMMAETVREATLYINKSDSRCGACGRGVSAYALSHDWLDGWYAIEGRRMKGCGAVFTAVASDYFGLPGMVEDIQKMRPDLPWVGGPGEPR